jgi:hypothetical protein
VTNTKEFSSNLARFNFHACGFFNQLPTQSSLNIINKMKKYRYFIKIMLGCAMLALPLLLRVTKGKEL